jgi:hypothetical protein
VSGKERLPLNKERSHLSFHIPVIMPVSLHVLDLTLQRTFYTHGILTTWEGKGHFVIRDSLISSNKFPKAIIIHHQHKHFHVLVTSYMATCFGHYVVILRPLKCLKLKLQLQSRFKGYWDRISFNIRNCRTRELYSSKRT